MFAALRKIPLTWWIGISMVVGILIGYLDNAVWTGVSLAPALQPISMIFIKMIKSIVVPLIFGSLVVAMTSSRWGASPSAASSTSRSPRRPRSSSASAR
jgi:Na+/H+-dicarboxylate symporter